MVNKDIYSRPPIFLRLRCSCCNSSNNRIQQSWIRKSWLCLPLGKHVIKSTQYPRHWFAKGIWSWYPSFLPLFWLHPLLCSPHGTSFVPLVFEVKPQPLNINQKHVTAKCYYEQKLERASLFNVYHLKPPLLVILLGVLCPLPILPKMAPSWIFSNSQFLLQLALCRYNQ